MSHSSHTSVQQPLFVRCSYNGTHFLDPRLLLPSAWRGCQQKVQIYRGGATALDLQQHLPSDIIFLVVFASAAVYEGLPHVAATGIFRIDYSIRRSSSYSSTHHTFCHKPHAFPLICDHADIRPPPFAAAAAAALMRNKQQNHDNRMKCTIRTQVE